MNSPSPSKYAVVRIVLCPHPQKRKLRCLGSVFLSLFDLFRLQLRDACQVIDDKIRDFAIELSQGQTKKL